jgi:DNA-binding IclR family transcriptional regulator
MKKKESRQQSSYTTTVPAVDEAARILLCLAESKMPKMRLTDICNIVGIHKSKGLSILNTLTTFGFVRKDEEGKTYCLGLGLVSLARKVLDRLNVREEAAPFLHELSRKTNSTALFGMIEEKGYAFVVAKQETDHSIGLTTRIGHRFLMTEGAAGKAMFAFLPRQEREELLKKMPLFFHGKESHFDRIRFDFEIAECRKTGYALDLGETFSGINVVAAPVFDSHEALLGSFFIMGTFPVELAEKHGFTVAGTARQFSSYLGADVSVLYERE